MHLPLVRIVHIFKSHPANRLEDSLRLHPTIAPSTTLHNLIRMTRRQLFGDYLVPVHIAKVYQHRRHSRPQLGLRLSVMERHWACSTCYLNLVGVVEHHPLQGKVIT
jgi:hypothetical protein